MNEIVKPGAGVLFMKIGTHAQEELADIIARKKEEISKTGYGMWGYGGNTCHPASMVQPFARKFAQIGQPIHLCMETMNSSHIAAPMCAAEYSVDGVQWEEIPHTIEVRGSKYALVIDQLREEQLKLPLDQTRVPVGPSTGRLGSRYVKGRVDKACLSVLDAPELTNEGDPREIDIDLVATLREPYAVFLRGER
ncbi:hypothetical protein [Consotaella salsifontis]|uniref:Uncharacterized protein n=1 Tax=Consotaella salsifontis TaxID=1365950 RepID=A0A1T4SUZ7_9HYPH|nr:hypothetical protein [Consotaella salsifontis]SKA31721.1 hypothetical protein SAMN05428963_11448 [Consotaella salsifontis]